MLSKSFFLYHFIIYLFSFLSLFYSPFIFCLSSLLFIYLSTFPPSAYISTQSFLCPSTLFLHLCMNCHVAVISALYLHPLLGVNMFFHRVILNNWYFSVIQLMLLLLFLIFNPILIHRWSKTLRRTKIILFMKIL